VGLEMNKEDKKRLEELRGGQIRLQAQCYLMKKGLETNEQELSRIAAVIAEYEAEEAPKPEPGKKKSDA